MLIRSAAEKNPYFPLVTIGPGSRARGMHATPPSLIHTTTLWIKKFNSQGAAVGLLLQVGLSGISPSSLWKYMAQKERRTL